MNIFGAFTFGSLIKTLLPGFVWLVAFAILEADLAQLRGVSSYAAWLITNKEQAASVLALAFPLAVLLGLLSNIVVFMGVNDVLVRQPVRSKEPQLFILYQTLAQMLLDQCWTTLGAPDDSLRSSFNSSIDPEVILVERLGAEKLAYMREQYWYHLEFQLNLLISLLAICLAMAVSSLLNYDPAPAALLIWVWGAVASALFVWLRRAARKNYTRHISKMASLLVALLSQKTEPKST